MKKLYIALTLALAASPAFAEEEAFFTLRSTEFVVTLAFLIFIGVLVYFKVPNHIGVLLDKRAQGIRDDLDAAKALHEEAKTLLASYETKQREVQALADAIVASARREAEAAAEQAKVDLKSSIERRLRAAQDQIASAEQAAVREVRDRAISVAVAAAGDLIGKQMTAADKARLIESAIADAGAKLH